MPIVRPPIRPTDKDKTEETIQAEETIQVDESKK